MLVVISCHIPRSALHFYNFFECVGFWVASSVSDELDPLKDEGTLQVGLLVEWQLH